jgi:hypothetical protein
MTILDMLRNDDLTQATADAFADPQPGDLFEEFYSVWVQVLARDGDQVTWRHGWGGPTFDDHPTYTGTVAEFGATFAYETIPGYSVKLYRRGTPNEPAVSP